MPGRGPPVHHSVRDFGMKLEREGAAKTDRLHFENVAFGEQLAAEGQNRSPLDAIDRRIPARSRQPRVRPVSGAPGSSRSRHAARVAKHFAAKKFGAHLRAETDAEERLVVFYRHADPFDFAADVIVAVVDAHGAAENDRGGMLGHGRRQWIAEARPPHVQRVAELLQSVAEAAGRRVFLVQNGQDRMLHEPIKAG